MVWPSSIFVALYSWGCPLAALWLVSGSVTLPVRRSPEGGKPVGVPTIGTAAIADAEAGP